MRQGETSEALPFPTNLQPATPSNSSLFALCSLLFALRPSLSALRSLLFALRTPQHHTHRTVRLLTGWLANRLGRGRAVSLPLRAATAGTLCTPAPHFSFRIPLCAFRSALSASLLALAACLFALCAFGCRTYYVTTNVYGLNNRIETKIPVDKTLDLTAKATVIP